jgi:hypothetical protein
MNKTWRFLECPECGDEGWTDEPRIEYCGICAGDCGRDVRMKVIARSEGDLEPTHDPRVATEEERMQILATCKPNTDDAEPITREWMRREFEVTTFAITQDVELTVISGELILEVTGEHGAYYANSVLPHIRTRGQLRQLLAALGWRREG